MTIDHIWPIAVGIAFVFVGIAFMRRFMRESGARAGRVRAEMNERMEALFRATFPELQPHFHPARVLEYVRARRGHVPSGTPSTWRKPPGFPAAGVAELAIEGPKDRVRLLDAAGKPFAAFVYEEHPDGGVIRLGKGKFTVNVKGPEPRVRYWHPEREFKWTPTLWKMKSGVSDHSLESSSSDSSTSSSSSPSSPSTAATAAAAGAGIVAAGGSFDGGGASHAWDDSGGGSSSSAGDSSPDFSSVESGSSSSSSTSY